MAHHHNTASSLLCFTFICGLVLATSIAAQRAAASETTVYKDLFNGAVVLESPPYIVRTVNGLKIKDNRSLKKVYGTWIEKNITDENTGEETVGRVIDLVDSFQLVELMEPMTIGDLRSYWQVIGDVLKTETSRLQTATDRAKFMEVTQLVGSVMKRDEKDFQIWRNRDSDSNGFPESAEALKESGALIFSTYAAGQKNPKFYFLKIAFNIIDDE